MRELGGVEDVKDLLLRYPALLPPVIGCRSFFAEGGKKKKEHSVTLYVLRG